MKIWTSYFANLRKIPKDIIPISICGRAPEGWKGLQYKRVAPKKSFFLEYKKTGDQQYYIEHFQTEVLDTLEPFNVLTDLYLLSEGKDIVLVCYEKPEDFCHRHLVADWLSKILEYHIEEYK